MNKYLKYFAFIIFIVFFYEICNDENSNKENNTSSVKYNSDKVDVDDDFKSEIEQTKTPRPENGFSPYNSYFGSGIYNNSTKNSIAVTAPEKADMVIFIRDIYSGRTIRNEYIRSNSTFTLTGLPYGYYKFFYLYGNNWDENSTFKNGAASGNFNKDKGVGKSDDAIDFEFKQGYIGTYTLKLQLLLNGNLQTLPSSEDEI